MAPMNRRAEPTKRAIISVFFLVTGTIALACREVPPFPQGWAWGAATHESAVFWIRAPESGDAVLEIETPAGPRRESLAFARENDFIARVKIAGLEPDTIYPFRILSAGRTAGAGRLRSAPAPDQKRPVRFVFGGDLGGQNACRDLERGYPIFDAMAAHDPDFFLGLGDLIYADNTCEAEGRFGNRQVPDPAPPAATLDVFRSKWKYNRSDESLRALLADTPYVPIWDDHEVINDFHPGSRGTPPAYDPDRPLLPLGLRAFREYHPLARGSGANASAPLYRRLRYGAHLELFILDTRSYRDPQNRPDRPTAPKTMLGTEQLAWLKRSLQASDARWKLIVSSVPIAVPTGKPGARDGWAGYDGDTGYENELGELFEFLGRENIRTVWLTTDVHFAAVFRYAPLPDRPAFTVHEIITGPLNAGLFPNRAYDESFRPERLFFHGPASPEAVTEYDQALGWFNYGLVEADAALLKVSIRDARGKLLYELKLP